MSSPTPFLSVVMPLYNGSAHVAEALQSLGAPQPDDVELIVVDDGSTDNSRQIVAGFQDQISITLLTQTHGGNWIQATNRGMEQARGDYVCWLHQDDRWEPDRLNILKRVLAHRPKCWLVHPSRFIDAFGSVLGSWRLPFARTVESVSTAEMHRRLCIQNFLAAPAPVFHRSLVDQVGLPDQSLWYTPDWEFWLRLSRAADCRICSQALTSFRIHDASQTVRLRSRTPELRREFDEVLSRHVDHVAGRTKRIGRLSAAINIALLNGSVSLRTLIPLLSCVLRTLPWDWPVYIRNSRILERVSARWRLRRQLATAGPRTVSGQTPPAPQSLPDTTTVSQPR